MNYMMLELQLINLKATASNCKSFIPMLSFQSSSPKHVSNLLYMQTQRFYRRPSVLKLDSQIIKFRSKPLAIAKDLSHLRNKKRGTLNTSTLVRKQCSCRIDFDKGASRLSLVGNVEANEKHLSSYESPVVHYASPGFLVDIEKSYLDNKYKECTKDRFNKCKNIILNEIELLKYTQQSIKNQKIKESPVPNSDLLNQFSSIFKTTSFSAIHTDSVNLKKLPQYYASLAKSRLTGLVVLTAMAGYAMAPLPFDLTSFAILGLGTALTSSSANSINQILEVKYDGIMTRTKNRVLVKGVLSPLHVLTFGAVCGASGISLLFFGVNELTGVLGAMNLIIYTSIYTPMKQISIANTWVGSIVGALPPMMGWAACSGSLSSGAFVMGSFLYAWQFPHFNALSWNIRHEYNKAGYKMMASCNPELCRLTSLRYCTALVPLSSIAPVVDLTTYTFAFASLPLNLYFTYLAWNFYKEADSKSSRKLFRFSLVHLPALMLLLLLTKKEAEEPVHKMDVSNQESSS